MPPRRLPLGTLPPGSRFRFPEEPPSEGFPYTVLPIQATYRGDQHFAPGEAPVVIQRQDGKYPRFGQVDGFFPVQNEDGRHVRWVARPSTLVLVPRPLSRLLKLGLLTLLAFILALAITYGMLIQLARP